MKRLGFTKEEALDAAKSYNTKDSNADLKAISTGFKL